MENSILYAENFAKKYNVSLEILSKVKEKVDWDNKLHWKFKCKLKRGKKSYTFTFTQSLHDNDKAPNIYEILACLQKYEVGNFEDFCHEYGYEERDPNNNHRINQKSYKVYKTVKRESEVVLNMFNDCLKELRKIW